MKITREITTIQMRGGYLIKVVDMRIRATYSNVWAGRPNYDLNKSLVEDGFNYPREWAPSQKVLLLRPKREVINTILPKYRIFAWLDCDHAIDPTFDGSWLVVSFFTDNLHDVSLKDLLHNTLQDIDWKFSSQDYPI